MSCLRRCAGRQRANKAEVTLNSAQSIRTVAAFAVGVVVGLLGAVTLRHEIWPLAERIGILSLYAMSSLLIFSILFLWYLRLIKNFRQRGTEPWGEQAVALFNFLIVFLIFLMAIGGGLIFVALG